MNAGTYTMPGVWYYFVCLMAQATVLFCATVYFSFCKRESKQFGLPKSFVFSRRFWSQRCRQLAQTSDVLRVENLSKSYAKREVIHSFGIQLHDSAICGVIGGTGAGKTTVLNILAGYTDFRAAADTRFEILGNNLVDPYVRLQMLDRIAICPQDKINMFDLLTVGENIKVFRSWSEIPDDLVREFLSLLNLEGALGKTFRQLSGGMQRRFALLVSLLQRPSLLLLDEMTANVDPLLKRNIWDAINRYFSVNRCCIILTSHDSNDINNIATQVAFLEDGSVRKQGQIREFVQQAPGMKLVVGGGRKEAVVRLLDAHGWGHLVNWDQRQCEIFVEVGSNEQFARLSSLLDAHIGPDAYSLVSYPINEVFYGSYRTGAEEGSDDGGPETQTGEGSALLEQGGQGPISRLQYANAYAKSALLSKFYEARQSRFMVLLVSLFTIAFFAVLEKLILDNVQKSPDRVSLQYYEAMRRQSFASFKGACVDGDRDVELQVFECLTSRRRDVFRKNCSVEGPRLSYMRSPQKYLDIVNFDNMEDYHFVFGHNSLGMSDYGDNYHVYVISNDSQGIDSQYFAIQNDGYRLGRDEYELSLTGDEVGRITAGQLGMMKYMDRRFVAGDAGLVSRSNFAPHSSLQELFNGYVRLQNNNTVERSVGSLSDSELLQLEFSLFTGIVDRRERTIYMQVPYYQLGKFYSNTQVRLLDANISQHHHFRHGPPDFGGPWYVDMDPVYPVNYANDVLSKVYTAELRQLHAGRNLTQERLFNEVYIRGEFSSMPRFMSNHIYQGDYSGENSIVFFSFMYFIPWIQCLLSIIALSHIHSSVGQFRLAFVNGMSISIFKYILSKVLIEMGAYVVKVFALYLAMWAIKPADAFLQPVVWVFPLLYSLSIVCFLFFLELLVPDYSISCLYLGAVVIIVVLVNPVMRPTLPFALLGSLFIPGLFYVVAGRMSALHQPFSGWWLVWGVLLQFSELFVLVLIKYLKTIRNSLAIRHDSAQSCILRAAGVSAYYSKEAPILRDFSLEIPRGQTICLAGANGCGKSTFTKCLTGYQVHFSGAISINERIGIVPQDDCFDRNLTVLQNLRQFSCFSGVSAERLCRGVGLGRWMDCRAGSLSAGLARILTISTVLATSPRLLILDEVTVGLDFAMKKQVWRAILAQDCSVLIITHDMLEIEALCDQVCIMQEGAICSQDSLEGTLKKADVGYILTVYAADAGGGFATRRFAQAQGARDVAEYLEQSGVDFSRWSLEKMSMESVFLHIIGKR